MSGTRLGGQKARETNYKRNGKDFYQRIGKIGGSKGTTGGFAANRELAKRAGAIGGSISVRGKAKTAEILEKAPEIRKLYIDGVPITEIAKTTGLSYCRVRYWIKNNL